MYLKLKKYIEQRLQIDTEKAQIFAEQFELKNLSKGDYFLQNGFFCKQIAFINKGAMYCVYNKDGNEIIDEFSLDREFITDYHSFLTNSPADKDVKCLEDTELMVISYEDLQELYAQKPIFEKVGRLMAEALFMSWQRERVRETGGDTEVLDAGFHRVLNCLYEILGVP